MLRLSRYTVIPDIMQVRYHAPKSAAPALVAYTLTLQPDGAAGYDIKEIVAAGSTVLTDGTASISATETAALS